MRIVLLAVVVACGGSRPPLANQPAPPHSTAFDADLALFRAAAGMPWNPDRDPAVAACRRIFHGMAFIGHTKADVVAELGSPDGVAGNDWLYMRHNGEVGCSHTLTLQGNTVVAVRENMTQ